MIALLARALVNTLAGVWEKVDDAIADCFDDETTSQEVDKALDSIETRIRRVEP